MLIHLLKLFADERRGILWKQNHYPSLCRVLGAHWREGTIAGIWRLPRRVRHNKRTDWCRVNTHRFRGPRSHVPRIHNATFHWWWFSTGEYNQLFIGKITIEEIIFNLCWLIWTYLQTGFLQMTLVENVIKQPNNTTLGYPFSTYFRNCLFIIFNCILFISRSFKENDT